jgi:putative spermidine/putrescine transport system permease protein
MSTAVSGSTDAVVLTAARPVRDFARLMPIALLAPGILVVGLGLVWPFMAMLVVSLQDKFPDATRLTVEHYGTVLTDPYFLRIIGRTFALAAVVTVTAAVVGYPVAWYLARSNSRWKHFVFLGVIAPLMVSIIVRMIGWTIILGNEGLINALLRGLGLVDEPARLMQGFWSVVLGLVHILLPFMILSIAAVLGKIDRSYAEAANVLGANPLRTFLSVTLPLSVQGIASGSVIVFCITVGVFVTPIMLGRGQVTVLAITIQEQMVVLVDWPTGAAAAMVLTAGTLIVLALYGLFIRRQARR